MTWSVYADSFDTSSSLTAGAKSQKITPKVNLFFKAIRTRVVLFNNPSFTNLKMAIHHNKAEDDSIGVLFETSINSFNLADLMTTGPYGLVDLSFEFSNKSLRSGDNYHLRLLADSYTPSSSSYISWAIGWPDPAYLDNLTVGGEQKILYHPYMILGVVGAKF